MERIYIAPEHYDVAQSNGISPETLYARVHVYGWDIDKAVSRPVPKLTDEFYHWKQIALDNGIPYNLFYDRVKRQNWSMEKAATQPPLTREQINHTLAYDRKNTILTPEQWEKAQQLGLSRQTIRARVKEYGWPIERAISTPIYTHCRRRQ